MGFLDDFDFSSLFDGAEGMTNDAPTASLGDVTPSFGGGAAAPSPVDLGTFDFDSGGAGIGGANPAFTPSGSPPPLATSGYNPGAATVGGTAPGQAQAAPSAPFGGETDPEQLARQGQTTNSWNPSTQSPVGSTVQQPPPPTAWESVKNAPGKWWDNASNEFAKAPIATTARVGALAAPLIGAGIGALTAPSTPKAPRAPAAVPNAQTDIPAASPMSTTLTGQGGFNVRSGQGLAEGGKVTSQDEADYQEAMRQAKGQSAQPPAQPAPKPKSAYDQQLEDADKGKNPKSGYFKRAEGGFVGSMTPEQQVEQLLQLQLRKFIPTLQSPTLSDNTALPTINLHPTSQGSRMPMADPLDLTQRSRMRGRGPGGPA